MKAPPPSLVEDTPVPDATTLDHAAAPAPGMRGRRPKRARLLAVLVAIVAAAGAVVALVAATRPSAPTVSVALGPPRFVEEAAGAGLVHAYEGEYPYVVGGGVAAFDCNDDGKADLYLAGGAGPAGLFRNMSPVGGALRFEALPDPATDLLSVTGAYPLDIDGDGITDLAVLRLGENVILRGLGGCRFERANEALDLKGREAWTVGFSATWDGAADMPTLAFGSYLGLDAKHQPTDECDDSAIVRPAASGRTYGPPVRLSPGWCSLSMLFSDWDRSGRRDLRVSNDRHYYTKGEEQLWRVEPGKAPRLYTRSEGWARLTIWGMGIASQDLTGDGRPEVYLTSQSDNKLQTLVDGATGPEYRDIALRRNVTAHRPYTGDEFLPSTAWHPEFADVNNDSFPDLFVSKGNVGGEADHAEKDPSNLLIGQEDGTFVEGAEAAGIVRFGMARGAALVDLNLDGQLDLVQVVRKDNVELWRNVGGGDAAKPASMGHWIAVGLEQAGVNRDAIGSWVEVRIGDRTIQREVTVGGGHAGGQLGWIHFGLGTADAGDVRITWPDGHAGPWLHVAADQFMQIDKDSATARPWAP
jgi:enediyne biosynthesis protein E4